MMQVPTAVKVTVAPEIVHSAVPLPFLPPPWTLNVTGLPEAPPTADTTYVPPTAAFVGTLEVNVMVCGSSGSGYSICHVCGLNG